MTKIITEQTRKTQSVQQTENSKALKKEITTTVPVGKNRNSQVQTPLLTPVFNDKIELSIATIQESLGLKHYTPTLTKDSISMLRKSQTNLIDLIKYYDGDPNYYYEGYTAVYSDTFGKKTSGFGHYFPKKTIKSQEEAYSTLAKDLVEINKVLKNKIGKDKYESLPLSIKEALIDLAFNKGPDKISKNSKLMNAITNNDYSKIVANLYYLTSGSNNADKTKEEAGLYRRSLSRTILATRDLTGKELEEAKKEVDALYKKAKKFYIEQAPNKNTDDLDNVYKCFKKEPITSKVKYTDNFKIVVKKGNTLYSTANEAYKAQNDTSVTMQKYREAFYIINKNPEDVKAGEELIAPAIKNIKAILGESEAVENKIQNNTVQKSDSNSMPQDNKTNRTIEHNDTVQNNIETPKEKSKTTDNSFWENAISTVIGAGLGFMLGITKKIHNPMLAGLTLLGAGIGLGLYKLGKWIFGGKTNTEKNIETEPQTVFQKLLKDKNTTITENGDFVIINGIHEVKKGNTIYGLSLKYGIPHKILCQDNDIKNPDLIKIDEKIKLLNILGYKVQKDDNIEKIAEKFGLTKEILMDLNDIEEDNENINNLEIIRIPGFPYVVKENDTLFGISKKVGVSINDLKKINHLESDTIYPNQKIIIVYNNSDFNIPDDKIVETTDNNNNKITDVDVTDKYKIGNRPELKTKRRINGKVVATRKVFEPTAEEKQNGKLTGKTIIVNAGHGYSESGLDIGNTGCNGLPDEWLINYDNAMKLKNKLVAEGARVIYLQGKKALIKEEIYKRENKADMFISVHANAAGPNASDRTQLVYRESEVSGKPKENSIKFAKIAEKNLDNWIKHNETIAERDKFYLQGKQDYAQLSTNDSRTNVLNPPLNHQHIPGIIWEVGFMTSKKGQQRLTNSNLMNNYAKVMTESIIEYFN